MAKIQKKTKNEPRKKSVKAAAVKSRTPTTPKKKPTAGVKAKVGGTKVKTAVGVKTPGQSGVSAKTTKKTSATKAVVVKKATVAGRKTAQKPVGRPQVAAPVKRTTPQPAPKTSKKPQKTATPVDLQEAVKTQYQPERKSFSQEELREMLLERRNGILKNFDEDIDTEEHNDSPGIMGDMVDIAQGSSENELSFHLAEVESRELGQIDMALEKINNGTYGVCEKCGEGISPARLKALPFASMCIRCQTEDEQAGY